MGEVGGGQDPVPDSGPFGVLGRGHARDQRISRSEKGGRGTGHGNRYLARGLGEVVCCKRSSVSGTDESLGGVASGVTGTVTAGWTSYGVVHACVGCAATARPARAGSHRDAGGAGAERPAGPAAQSRPPRAADDPAGAARGGGRPSGRRPDRQGGWGPAVGGHAGAAPGGARLQRRRQADTGVGPDVRRGARRRWPGTCWRRRSTRCGSSPAADVGMLGVGVQTTFVRGALDRLGIEPQLDQRHEFKNAADRIMRTEFTEAHRAALDRLAESVFTDAVDAIAQGRGLDKAAVRALVDGGPRRAAQAKDAGLVDKLGYRDQAYAAMRDRVGKDAELLFADRWRPRRRPRLPRRPRGHVALVEVRGTISPGALAASPDGQDRRQRHGGCCAPRGRRRRPRPRGRAAGGLTRGFRGGLGDDLARGRPAARGQAGDRLDGRAGRVRRLLHRLPCRRDPRPARHPHRVDRRVRRQGGRAGAARAARPDHRNRVPRRARR